MAAILKIQNGGHAGISAIINFGFQVPHAITLLTCIGVLIYHDDSERNKP